MKSVRAFKRSRQKPRSRIAKMTTDSAATPGPFSTASVYLIRSPHHSDMYIGSTTQPLQTRFREHYYSWFMWIQSRSDKYISVYNVLKRGDAAISLLESFPCGSRAELESREGYWQNKLPCVNARIMGRTKQESSKASYRKHHASRLAKIHAYKLAHAAEINAPNDCECGGHFIFKHTARHLKSQRHQSWSANHTADSLPHDSSVEASS